MKSVLTVIGQAYKLLQLPPDWDEDGALPADPVIFNEAMIFMHLMLFNMPDLIAPQISLCRDATIDLSFRNFRNGYELLVNVRKGSISCFGDDGKGNDKIKSPGVTTSDITEWCKKYMVKQ